jgi:hypothetical protein
MKWITITESFSPFVAHLEISLDFSDDLKLKPGHAGFFVAAGASKPYIQYHLNKRPSPERKTHVQKTMAAFR